MLSNVVMAWFGSGKSNSGANNDASIHKSIRSLEKRISEHEQKLADYISDPDRYDNQGLLKNAPNETVRQRVIQGRINHLQGEIQTWRDSIEKLRAQLTQGE